MDLRLLPFRFPGIAGVGCAFQMALPARPGASQAERGNISLEAGSCGADDEAERVIANRAALRDMLGLRGLAEVRQVHGVVTLFEPEEQELCRAPGYEADGLAASRAPERELTGLMIKTADCQPYLWRTGTAAISWPCIRAGGGAAGAIPGLPWRSSASITACPLANFPPCAGRASAGPRGVHAVRGRMGRGVHGVF